MFRKSEKKNFAKQKPRAIRNRRNKNPMQGTEQSEEEDPQCCVCVQKSSN